MNCPVCQHPENRVTDSRGDQDLGIRRRRECCHCRHRWTTREVPESRLKRAERAVRLVREMADKLSREAQEG